MPTTAQNRLPKFEQELRKLCPELDLSPVIRFEQEYGETRPSTCVRLSISPLEIKPCYAPWPKFSFTGSQARGAVFLSKGAVKVFPVMRVVQNTRDRDAETYLDLDNWLFDALTNWAFKTNKSDRQTSTFAAQIKLATAPKSKLLLIQNCIDYAVLGSKKNDVVLNTIFKHSPENISAAPRHSCLMESVDTASSFHLLEKPFSEFRISEHSTLDTVKTCVRNRMKLQNNQGNVFSTPTFTGQTQCKFGSNRKGSHNLEGIDPYHTPEDDDARLKLHLSRTAQITEKGKLEDSKEENPHSLSASTSQIPYSGYNEPRRLLLGTKQLNQSQELCESDRPLVVSRQHRSELDPPGRNLRVAFLAWAGWNHEDAWVISESCAQKLRCRVMWKQTIQIPIHATYVAPNPGDSVDKGQSLAKIKQNNVFLNEEVTRGEMVNVSRENKAEHNGKIIHVTIHEASHDPCSPKTTSTHWDSNSRKTTTAVITVYLQRELPCEVGDKLANRHGHKGVVGLILPDKQMPKWRDKPLEVLIDPISVVNRANWGQVYETLAGGMHSDQSTDQAIGSRISEKEFPDLDSIRGKDRSLDENGRTNLEFSPICNWHSMSASFDSESESRPLRGIAGSQFVMRLGQHATEKIKGHSPSENNQRIDKLSRFSLWAHDIATSEKSCLSKAAGLLSLGLWLIGVNMRLTNDQLIFERLDLSNLNDRPANAEECHLEPGKKTKSMETQLLQLVRGKRHYYKLKKPLTINKRCDLLPWDVIHWLPIVSMEDIRAICNWQEETEFHPRLPSTLEDLASAIVRGEKDHLNNTLTEMMEEAARHLLGSNEAGEPYKNCYWRKQVLAQEISNSAQAVITPSGLPLEKRTPSSGDKSPLTLNEVTLPTRFKNLFPAESDNNQMGNTVWLKRDPVLHRYGFLPLTAKWNDQPSNTIQISASLLTPLAADFDGDTATVFAIRTDMPQELSAASNIEKCRPSKIHWDTILDEPKFKPTKQYQHGLHLLQQSAAHRKALNTALKEHGAPSWPDSENPIEALSNWLKQVSQREVAEDCWWSILETHALFALSRSPDMGFGLAICCDTLKEMACVESKAANIQLYENTKGGIDTGNLILSGKGLGFFSQGWDPILSAMDEKSKGEFGTESERLIARRRELRSSGIVKKIQAFTEELQQEALNTKKTTDRYKFNGYETDLKESLKQGKPAGRLQNLPERLHDELKEIVADRENAASSFEYLIYKPQDLLEKLSPCSDSKSKSNWNPLMIRLDDIRASIFFH